MVCPALNASAELKFTFWSPPEGCSPIWGMREESTSVNLPPAGLFCLCPCSLTWPPSGSARALLLLSQDSPRSPNSPWTQGRVEADEPGWSRPAKITPGWSTEGESCSLPQCCHSPVRRVQNPTGLVSVIGVKWLQVLEAKGMGLGGWQGKTGDFWQLFCRVGAPKMLLATAGEAAAAGGVSGDG